VLIFIPDVRSRKDRRVCIRNREGKGRGSREEETKEINPALMLCYNFLPNFVCPLQHCCWSEMSKELHFVMEYMHFTTTMAIFYSQFYE